MSLESLPHTATVAQRASADWARFLAWAQAQPLSKLAFLAAAILAVIDIAVFPARISIALGDTDDATRLIEVRQLMAGQGWFDMTMPRFGGSQVLVSHWSRLIDLPLALMMTALAPLFGPQAAEIITRLAWPTLLSATIIWCAALYVDTIAARTTTLLAIALATAAMGHFQFAPGRIDHHSGMIIGAVGGTFALLTAIDRPRFGWLAGLLFGLGVAIGYEGLGLTIAALTLVTLTCVLRATSLAGCAHAAIAFAATLSVCYPLFGPFRPDLYVVCDALSTNLIALAVSAAFGVGLAHMARQQGAPTPVVFGFVAVSGVVGIGLYALTNPVCLGGPYADLDPRLTPIWLNIVGEVQPFWSYYKTSILDLKPFILYFVAVAYGVIVVRAKSMRHADLYLAIFLVTLALGLWQIRLLPYASFLAGPLIALGLHRPASAPAAAAKPFAWPKLPELSPRQTAWAMNAGVAVALIVFGAGAVISLATVKSALHPATASAATAPTAAAGSGVAVRAAQPSDQECSSKTAMLPLVGLEKGLAANDIDIGPFIVAFTSLDVLAAPYHRMGSSILANHDLMFASAPEAELRMRKLGARYVVLCYGAGSTIPAAPVPGDYLRAALMEGRAPDFLEPVALAGTPVKVWRLKDR